MNSETKDFQSSAFILFFLFITPVINTFISPYLYEKESIAEYSHMLYVSQLLAIFISFASNTLYRQNSYLKRNDPSTNYPIFLSMYLFLFTFPFSIFLPGYFICFLIALCISIISFFIAKMRVMKKFYQQGMFEIIYNNIIPILAVFAGVLLIYEIRIESLLFLYLSLIVALFFIFKIKLNSADFTLKNINLLEHFSLTSSSFINFLIIRSDLIILPIIFSLEEISDYIFIYLFGGMALLITNRLLLIYERKILESKRVFPPFIRFIAFNTLLIILVIIFAPIVIENLLPEDYHSAGDYAYLLILTLPLKISHNIQNIYFIKNNIPVHMLKFRIFIAFIFLLSLYFLISFNFLNSLIHFLVFSFCFDLFTLIASYIFWYRFRCR